jgi:hypothetical protein
VGAFPFFILITAAILFVPAALANLAVSRLGSRLNWRRTRLSWPWLAALVLLVVALTMAPLEPPELAACG